MPFMATITSTKLLSSLTMSGLELPGTSCIYVAMPSLFNSNLFRAFVSLYYYVDLLLLYCSRDPDLVKRIGEATALEVRATGIPYVFAPCIAVIGRSSFCTVTISFGLEMCPFVIPFKLMPIAYMILLRFVEIQDGDAAMRAIVRTQRLSSQ